jgi:hypothetical protein
VIELYAGFDPREEVGFHTFVSSVIHHSTEPVCVTPLDQALLRSVWGGGHRDGSNAFTYLRFLIPYLQGFSGWALFCDGSDMVVRDDISKLWAMRDFYKAVQVVKHEYRTRHPRKYVGTSMESDNRDYPCKNWSSAMLINCSHFDWRNLTPGTVAKMSGSDLHQFSFVRPDRLGALPVEWNWLVDEYGENPEAKLLHWTAGIPAWPHYADAPMADEWAMAALRARHATT